MAQTLKTGKRISNPTYISQTALQFASTAVDAKFTFWVTDIRAVPPPPVADAVVTMYIAPYGEVRVCVCGGVTAGVCRKGGRGTLGCEISLLWKIARLCWLWGAIVLGGACLWCVDHSRTCSDAPVALVTMYIVPYGEVCVWVGDSWGVQKGRARDSWV